MTEYAERRDLPRSREHAYDPVRKRELSKRRWGNALKVVAGVGVATAVALGAGEVLKGFDPKPSEAYTGDFKISEGVNLRTSPDIPGGSQSGSNVVSWEKVKSWNGVDLKGATTFYIEHPEITKGQNAADSRKQGLWITIPAVVNNLGIDTEENLYISIGQMTSGFVEPEGGEFVNLQQDQDGKMVANIHGETLTEDELGKVSVEPPNN